jgi:16S rRNA (cytidine1402-2'-O)-methyltransferase
MSGILYLVPVPISETDPRDELAPRVVRVVAGIRYFIVENDRSARRFLSKMLEQPALDASIFGRLDEHTQPAEFEALLQPILAGTDGAIISEAGSPCVADPGSDIVALAHGKGIRTVPLPGPSSILLAVMASGMGGQRWAFRGYLPPDAPSRESALVELEAISARDRAAQVFIETPYRNDAMAASASRVLRPETIFCAAAGLSGQDERIMRMRASDWRIGAPTIGKVPTVFLLLSPLDSRNQGSAGTRPVKPEHLPRKRRNRDGRTPR